VLTDTQRRALAILDSMGPLRPREFGRLLWPGARGWARVGKCGTYGSTRGVGMCLASGAYLGKLRARGWVKRDYHMAPWGLNEFDGYTLTHAGRAALMESRSEDNG
jgi:hypothetical protein